MPQTLPFWQDPLVEASASIPDAPFGVGPWDFVVFGLPNNAFAVLPGVCKVDVVKGRRIDVKQPLGRDGAILTAVGFGPAKVTIALTMWSAKQWAMFQQMLPQFEPTPGKYDPDAPAFGIAHPATSARNISAVLFEEISAPAPSPDGLYVITFKCVEWVKPNPALAWGTPVTDQPVGQPLDHDFNNIVHHNVDETAPSKKVTPLP